MSFLNDLKFEKSKVKFCDNRKMVEATLDGTFERADIKLNFNELAKQFNSPRYQLGIAIHFKTLNKWVPAIMRQSNKPMMLWEESDDTPLNLLENDYLIDKIRIYIVEDKN